MPQPSQRPARRRGTVRDAEESSTETGRGSANRRTPASKPSSRAARSDSPGSSDRSAKASSRSRGSSGSGSSRGSSQSRSSARSRARPRSSATAPRSLAALHGERVAVSVDARGGMLAGAGWREQTGIPVEVAVKRLCALGVRHLVYSSIDRDGTLAGPDLDGARRIAALVQGSLLYSGGISALADLERLVSRGGARLAGVIVGRALYEGRFTVSEAQAVLDGATRGRCTTSA